MFGTMSAFFLFFNAITNSLKCPFSLKLFTQLILAFSFVAIRSTENETKKLVAVCRLSFRIIMFPFPCYDNTVGNSSNDDGDDDDDIYNNNDDLDDKKKHDKIITTIIITIIITFHSVSSVNSIVS